MAKSSSVFICQNCGESQPKWQGQCPSCGEWGTLVETLVEKKNKKSASISTASLASISVPFSQVGTLEVAKQRFSTGIGEFDRVLGRNSNNQKEETQGIVSGAVMLIGGEPGIGKSTLLTQMIISIVAKALSDSSKKSPETFTQSYLSEHPIIYIAGEESPSQISLRINRIMEVEYKNKGEAFVKNLGEILGQQLVFITSVQADEIVESMTQLQPSLVIVDSIQTLVTPDLLGTAGSAGQVRESADRVTQAAKRLQIPVFLVGHVTKEGTIAGPKILEHIVDAVLELSGERSDDLRLLRTLKNRFGPTDEVGVFRVSESGLTELSNPSELFLEHADQQVPGNATVCVIEGTRPLMLEVQALVIDSQLAMPRRVGRGIDLSRIQILAAILQKHCHLPLGSSDVFLSAAGGFKVKEPSVDLGLAVAMASSLKNKALPAKTIFIGEVGLLGEIRAVSHFDRRVKEAKRLGFTKIVSRKTHRSVREVLKEFGL